MKKLVFKENLEKLMDFYDETKADLARATGLLPQDISKVFSRKEPSKTSLELIAYHYNISEEDLKFKKLDSIDKFYLNRDKEKYFKKLYRLIFPITTSKTAEKDEFFLDTYKQSKQILSFRFNNIKKINEDLTDTIDMFLATYDDEGIPEALANAAIMIAFAEYLVNNPILLNILKKDDNNSSCIELVKKCTLNYVDKDLDDNILLDISSDDLNDYFIYCAQETSKINKYSDLIDYLYAIRYMCGFSHNDLSRPDKTKIYNALLCILLEKDNKYAKKLIETLSKIII